MPDKNVFLGELTRKELGAAIEGGVVQGAIVPTGATEQHQSNPDAIGRGARPDPVIPKAGTDP